MLCSWNMKWNMKTFKLMILLGKLHAKLGFQVYSIPMNYENLKIVEDSAAWNKFGNVKAINII